MNLNVGKLFASPRRNHRSRLAFQTNQLCVAYTLCKEWLKCVSHIYLVIYLFSIDFRQNVFEFCKSLHRQTLFSYQIGHSIVTVDIVGTTIPVGMSTVLSTEPLMNGKMNCNLLIKKTSCVTPNQTVSTVDRCKINFQVSEMLPNWIQLVEFSNS